MNNFIPINLKILAKWINSQDTTKYQNEIRRNRSVSNPITITETSSVLKCFPPRKMDTLANSTKFVRNRVNFSYFFPVNRKRMKTL